VIFLDKYEILKTVDHTLLKQDATWDNIKILCDDAIKYNTASVCISPYFVKAVKDYYNDSIKICTVIGFPNGYSTTEVKLFETKNAIQNGASEIDMVINISAVKDENFDYVLDEITQLATLCHSFDGVILKVIIETCLLTQDEIAKMCEIVLLSSADFIKTSTGFSTNGATFEDVDFMKKTLLKLPNGESLKIKAAGGISSFEDAEKFLSLGANRLGTSRLVKLMKQ
jgi:deoxyribose-phosphate aldolase